MMGRVVHFEIHAAEPERALKFYTDLFGWKFSPIPGMPYWGIETGAGEGINGGMLKRMGPPPSDGQPVNAFVCTVHVDSVDASFDKAQKIGGAVALPKMPIPGVGWLAYVKDTEGNIIGLMQPDPSAK